MEKLDSEGNERQQPGTFASSGSLPRVPLPELIATADRFLQWCAPLLTAEELEQTQASLTAFTKPDGLGRKLHAALKSFDDEPDTHSWLDIFWPSRYLGRRDPIALNANFFFLFQHAEMERSKRAAILIGAALNYKLALDVENIPSVMNRQTPLCMDQVKYLFSATRIPGEDIDSLRSAYSSEQPGPSAARHIIILYRGHVFTLDLISAQGQPYTLVDIEAGVNAILAEVSVDQVTEQTVGHLTTMRRADWARTRKVLLDASPRNATNLDMIETALFAINLEDLEPSENLAACNQLLHGGNGNRWYDKALQLIIFKNGVAGINVEHCSLDGTTILNFVDTILGADPLQLDEHSGAVSQGDSVPKELVFDLDAMMQKKIGEAAQDFNKLRTTTVTRLFDFPAFGGSRIKSCRMSPDAFVQCAMQLAHFRSKGFIGATYESIATRQYERGRTEAMRTVTPEVLTFVETMEDESKSVGEKIGSFRAAGDKHVGRARECQQGQAPEQHLWELLNIYNRNPERFQTGLFSRLFQGGLSSKDIDAALALFDSPGWMKMRSDALSTSSAPSPSIINFGFGSTGPGCIGVGYLVGADSINSYLSTAQGEDEALESFMTHWAAALSDLAELLEQDPALAQK